MPSDRFIQQLVGELKPIRRRRVGIEALALASLFLVELALFLGLGAMRPDMPVAMRAASFWWKLGSLGLIALVGVGVAVCSLDPVRSPRSGLRWLTAIIAVSLTIGWAIDASRDGMPGLAARLNWPDGLRCVSKMVLLSVPAAIGLGLLIRRGAATDSGGTALAAGIAAAAWGAFVFVFACPHDDPLYIALWYAVGCGIVTLASRLLLPRLTRW